MNNNNGFFAVDKERFYRACDLGINQAISYLVLCNGTQKDNTTTSWSANAVETYTGISRGRTKKAINSLIENELITVIQSGTKPRYLVKEKHTTKKLDAESVVWLPSGLVVGVSGETPPIERIRQAKEIMVLRMFFDLYKVQNLIEDGGIPKDLIHKSYERKKLCEYGQYSIYGFRLKYSSGTWNELTRPHKDESNGDLLWSRVRLLEDMKLIRIIPYLYDSDDEDGEPVHVIDSDINDLAYNCSKGAVSKVITNTGSDNIANEHDIMIPVPRDKPNAAVVGIYQLVYKARTSMTDKWYVEEQEAKQEVMERFNELLAKVSPPAGASNAVGFI